MSVYKPQNSSIFLYDFQMRGRRFHGSTGQKTKRAAEQVENKVRAEAALDVRRKPIITLDDAAGKYEDKTRKANRWSDDTERWIRAFIESVGANVFMNDIKETAIIDHFSRRAATRAGSSINREIDCIKALFNFTAASKYDIGDQPNWRAMKYATVQHDPRVLSEDEETRLFEALREDYHPFARFLLESGWRVSEARRLSWRYVDFPGKKARVQLKGGKIASRPLSDTMIDIIARMPQVEDCPYVFTYVCQKKRKARKEGQRYPFSRDGWRKAWGAALAAADIEEFRPHDLRHTAGTRVLRSTGNLVLAQKALGHTNINTTLRYAHATDDDVRAALDAASSRNNPEVKNQNAEKARNSAA